MKELTKIYGDLLQDKRVRAEQSKYETITRQHNSVMGRYKKVYDAFNGLLSGILQAQTFYTEMSETVASLKGNAETFINNRRSEGAQLLSQIENDKANGAADQEDREREKLQQLMGRLSTDPKSSGTSPSSMAPSQGRSPPPPSQTPAYPSVTSPRYSSTTAPPMQGQTQPQPPPPPPINAPVSHSPAPYTHYRSPSATGAPYVPSQQPFQQGAAAPLSEGYNPMAYPFPASSVSSPPPPPASSQQYYSTTQSPYGHHSHGSQHFPGPSPSPAPSQYMPPGYVPPPPPPRPQTTTYPPSTGPFPSGPGGYAQSRPYGASHRRGQSQSQSQSQQGPAPPSGDPWAGLSAWK